MSEQLCVTCGNPREHPKHTTPTACEGGEPWAHAFKVPLGQPVRVRPENFWREVWHEDCPERGPMVRLAGRLTIDDGTVLREYECLGCGVRCYAGLDANRFVVTRLRFPEAIS